MLCMSTLCLSTEYDQVLELILKKLCFDGATAVHKIQGAKIDGFFGIFIGELQLLRTAFVKPELYYFMDRPQKATKTFCCPEKQLKYNDKVVKLSWQIRSRKGRKAIWRNFD